MAGIPTTTMRIDPKLKEQANEVFDDLGLNMSTAVNMFLKAVVREQGMPFNLHTGTDKDPNLPSLTRNVIITARKRPSRIVFPMTGN